VIARTGVLVDTNVIIDVLSADPLWQARSERALAEAGDRAALVINPIIYAELSASFESSEELARYVDASDLRREDLPWEAAYLAGRAYVRYRRNGGDRRTPLPDFYIGAHAATRGYPLLTRDPSLYLTYFPAVPLLSP